MEPQTPNTVPNPSTPNSNPAPDGQDTHEPSREHVAIEQSLREYHSKGRMTDAELVTALQELTGDTEAQLAPDKRTESQRAFDAQFPVAKPEHYNFGPPERQGNLSKEEQAFDTAARGWLAAGRFDKALGSALASECQRVAKQLEGFKSPAEHELFRLSERRRLEKMWGADTGKNIQMAKDFVAELAQVHPEIVRLLDSGLGDAAGIVVRIHAQAQRLLIRNGETT